MRFMKLAGLALVLSAASCGRAGGPVSEPPGEVPSPTPPVRAIQNRPPDWPLCAGSPCSTPELRRLEQRSASEIGRGIVLSAVVERTHGTPDSVLVNLRIENRDGVRHYLGTRVYCPVHLIVARSPGEVRRPMVRGRHAWYSGFQAGCEFLPLHYALEPEASREFRKAWPVSAILGDSLRPGVYHLTPYAELNDSVYYLPTSAVTLGGNR